MPKSSIDAKFLAGAWAMLDHANAVGVQCCLIWRLDDEDFTWASTLKGSSEVRAMLTEVIAHIDVAAADYLVAREPAATKQRKKAHGET